MYNVNPETAHEAPRQLVASLLSIVHMTTIAPETITDKEKRGRYLEVVGRHARRTGEPFVPDVSNVTSFLFRSYSGPFFQRYVAMNRIRDEMTEHQLDMLIAAGLININNEQLLDYIWAEITSHSVNTGYEIVIDDLTHGLMEYLMEQTGIDVRSFRG